MSQTVSQELLLFHSSVEACSQRVEQLRYVAIATFTSITAYLDQKGFTAGLLAKTASISASNG
jgi:hypothetical protein